MLKQLNRAKRVEEQQRKQQREEARALQHQINMRREEEKRRGKSEENMQARNYQSNQSNQSNNFRSRDTREVQFIESTTYTIGYNLGSRATTNDSQGRRIQQVNIPSAARENITRNWEEHNLSQVQHQQPLEQHQQPLGIQDQVNESTGARPRTAIHQQQPQMQLINHPINPHATPTRRDNSTNTQPLIQLLPELLVEMLELHLQLIEHRRDRDQQ